MNHNQSTFMMTSVTVNKKVFNLTHFIPPTTSDFLIFSEGIERNQWHKMGLIGALGCPKGQIPITNITNRRTTPRNSFCSKLYLFQQEKQRKWRYFTALNRITVSVHNMVKRTLKILHQMLQWMLSPLYFCFLFSFSCISCL